MDKNGDMIYVSPSAKQKQGYEPEELMGQGWWTLSRIDSKDGVPEKELLRDIATGNRPLSSEPYTRAIIAKDGRQIWIEWQDALGPNQTVIGVGRDVTERRQAELEIERGRDFLETVIQTAHVIFLQVDTTGKVLRVNSATEQITGYSAAELVGSDWGLKIVPRDAFPLVWQEFDRITSHGEMPETFENQLITKSGEYRDILWKNSQLREGDRVVGLVSFGIDITETKKAFLRNQEQLSRLKALSQIDRVILTSYDLELNLKLLLRDVAAQLKVDAANIMISNSATRQLKSIASYGFKTPGFEQGEVDIGDGFAGRVALDRKPVFIKNLDAQAENRDFLRVNADEDFVSYYGLPLVAKGQTVGVLEIFHRSELKPSEDWVDFLATIADQAAIAIDTIQTFEVLQKSQLELALSYEAAIEGWSRALDLRHREPAGHSQRVAALSVDLARQMGIKGEAILNISRGALLHDIGKMGIPDSLLFKEGELSESEREMLRQHPSYARDMLEGISYLKDAADIPYGQHERWDGSGFPRGLKGPQIPIAARILAVADIFDALTHEHKGKPAMSLHQALATMDGQAGILFDPGVVKALMDLKAGKSIAS
jgi:PAS domain S-box-containing protein